MNTPRATYRLQFNREFTFSDAKEIVPYLAALGVSHIYASPISTARPGSMHGYDVVDPTTVSAEIGGEDGLRDLVSALRRHGLGLIVDIVPNHMAADRANAWWMNVLAHGKRSHYAKFFDIDWDPPVQSLKNKVLLPILGRPYGEALEASELSVENENSEYTLRYFDHVLPLSDNSNVAGPDSFQPSSTGEGHRRLHALLEQQHYRLCWWRSANDLINWRRFFDINELIAICVEDNDVFATVHATHLRLYAEGLIDGFRVDHIDGLTDPRGYCQLLRKQLQALAAQRPASCPRGSAYFVVEKILEGTEKLPSDWQTDGTTGYDFMDTISALFHEPSAKQKLSEHWHRLSGRSPDFGDEERLARRQILERSFSAQLEALIASFTDLAEATLITRDYSTAAIARCLIEILVNFPVYRTYTRVNNTSSADRLFLSEAVRASMETCLPSDRWLLPILEGWLSGHSIDDEVEGAQNNALVHFQQLSAPLCAKAVEDTAFYRYGVLLSRNDVGFDPRHFSCSREEFHERMRARQNDFPRAMLATATHDHKRGEDVRARLAVLSELADGWCGALDRWLKKSANISVERDIAPTSGDIAMLLQMIIAAWPLNLKPTDQGGLEAYRIRIAAWQQKALREAKLRSDWSAPDEAYESAAADFLGAVFSERDIISDLYEFSERIAAPGAINGLSQILIKLTVPGVPDTYQGTEYWDLSLVDPDNRTAVDFAARQNSFLSSSLNLLSDWRNGLVKQALVSRVLAVRKDRPNLFAEGNYIALEVAGPFSEHFLAFARVSGDDACIVIVPRFVALKIRDSAILSFACKAMQATTLSLSRALHGRYRNAMSDTDVDLRNGVSIAALLGNWPVGILLRTATSKDG